MTPTGVDLKVVAERLEIVPAASQLAVKSGSPHDPHANSR